jgi:hypothetical protein
MSELLPFWISLLLLGGPGTFRRRLNTGSELLEEVTLLLIFQRPQAMPVQVPCLGHTTADSPLPPYTYTVQAQSPARTWYSTSSTTLTSTPVLSLLCLSLAPFLAELHFHLSSPLARCSFTSLTSTRSLDAPSAPETTLHCHHIFARGPVNNNLLPSPCLTSPTPSRNAVKLRSVQTLRHP